MARVHPVLTAELAEKGVGPGDVLRVVVEELSNAHGALRRAGYLGVGHCVILFCLTSLVYAPGLAATAYLE